MVGRDEAGDLLAHGLRLRDQAESIRRRLLLEHGGEKKDGCIN